ncbi:MAG: hypothetical protein JWN52_8015 [Actinomycetia bacterium]|nr:hypothetical protein [Actinomycetes bacterium]
MTRMTAAAGRKITVLRGDGVTLAEAGDEFLSTNRVANPNTHRAYASAIDRTIAEVGGGTRRLAEVTDEQIGDALAALWGGCKPATWLRHRRLHLRLVRHSRRPRGHRRDVQRDRL